MSYDLTFVRVGEGQSVAEAMEAIDSEEHDLDEDAADSGEPDPALQSRLRDALRAVEPRLVDHGTQWEDPELGIDISLWASEASVSVPFWYAGEAAATVVRRMYEYAAVVERVTNLSCWDPQVELPLEIAAQRIELAVECFDHVARSFAIRGIDSPSAAHLRQT